MTVYCIVVTYNAIKWIDRCFGSLRGSTIPLRVIAVDNCSTDDTVIHVKNIFPEVELIETGQNLGFGKANNIGLKIALNNDADYVYLLNQDACIDPDTIEKLIEVHKVHPEYAILSPIQVNPAKNKFDKNFAYCCNELFCSDFTSDIYFNNLKKVYKITDVMAAHWLISKKCLKSVGGFSPVFEHYGEDNNYIHRVHYHGFEVGICPNIYGVHDREFREISVKKKIGFLYTSSFLTIANNINNGLLLSLVKAYSIIFTKGIIYIFRFKSILPMLYILKSIYILPSIVKYRKLTIKKENTFI